MSNWRVKLVVKELNKLFSKLKPEDVKGLDADALDVLNRIKALKDNPDKVTEAELQNIIISINILKGRGLF